MKFAFNINMERHDSSQDMRDVARNGLELVRIAEQGGFEMALVGEHHMVELVISPNPFAMLSYWGSHTSKIRLCCGVVQAAYWHPIRLAAEAALCDVLTNGRLEFGIARGAFQYEFNRFSNGMDERKGVDYVKETLPAVLKLWSGDYEHKGELFSFPMTTSVPKPVQKPHPPIWVAARDPQTMNWAVGAGANIMASPLSRPASEVLVIGEKFKAACAAHPSVKRPRLLIQRRTCVYDSPSDWRVPVDAQLKFARAFETLFQNIGGVKNGFAEPADLATVKNKDEYVPETVKENFVFGTPDECIEKLKVYEEVGTDVYSYSASFGLDWKVARRSLELFIERVMPAFVDRPHASGSPALRAVPT
jgi:alkanesulfonate monooxygenase SsuD/methylene tetrahydromethanopterin reductase-like flavin-dependent oxidoreductase (luciferase family)